MCVPIARLGVRSCVPYPSSVSTEFSISIVILRRDYWTLVLVKGVGGNSHLHEDFHAMRLHTGSGGSDGLDPYASACGAYTASRVSPGTALGLVSRAISLGKSLSTPALCRPSLVRARSVPVQLLCIVCAQTMKRQGVTGSTDMDIGDSVKAFGDCQMFTYDEEKENHEELLNMQDNRRSNAPTQMKKRPKVVNADDRAGQAKTFDPKTLPASVRQAATKAGVVQQAPARQRAAKQTSRICVCVRKRPLNRSEAGRGEQDVCRANSSSDMTLMVPKVKVDLTKYTERHNFVFDEVFDEHDTNEDIYERCPARSLTLPWTPPPPRPK